MAPSSLGVTARVNKSRAWDGTVVYSRVSLGGVSVVRCVASALRGRTRHGFAGWEELDSPAVRDLPRLAAPVRLPSAFAV